MSVYRCIVMLTSCCRCWPSRSLLTACCAPDRTVESFLPPQHRQERLLQGNASSARASSFFLVLFALTCLSSASLSCWWSLGEGKAAVTRLFLDSHFAASPCLIIPLSPTSSPPTRPTTTALFLLRIVPWSVHPLPGQHDARRSRSQCQRAHQQGVQPIRHASSHLQTPRRS